MKVKTLLTAVLAACLLATLMTGCKDDGDSSGPDDVLATETWTVDIDEGTGNGLWTATLHVDSTRTIAGSFNIDMVTSSFVSATLEMEGSQMYFNATGTAKNTEAPAGYQTSDFTLQCYGVLEGGAGAGAYNISFTQTGWPETLYGAWTGAMTDGEGVTP